MIFFLYYANLNMFSSLEFVFLYLLCPHQKDLKRKCYLMSNDIQVCWRYNWKVLSLEKQSNNIHNYYAKHKPVAINSQWLHTFRFI